MRKRKNQLTVIMLTAVVALLTSCIQGDYNLDDSDMNILNFISGKKLKSDIGGGGNMPQYPGLNQIMGSTVVLNQISAAWDSTMQACTPSGRREYGFWIYYSFNTNTFYCGNIFGSSIYPTNVLTTPHISAGNPSNGFEACAFFHTHPSMMYFDRSLDWTRPVGCSYVDETWADSHHYPCIVLDYITDDRPGLNKNRAHDYYYCGPYRRQINH